MQRLVTKVGSPWTFSSRHFHAFRCTTPVLSAEGSDATTETKVETNVVKKNLWNRRGRKPEKPLPPVTEVIQLMHDELIQSLRKKEHFSNKQLYEMFGACANYADLKLGLHVLDRLHKARAANLWQFEGFNSEVHGVVARAFVKVKRPSAALEVFSKYNVYGLSPNINVSHELLKYATEVNDSRLTRSILKHMVQNSIKPTAVSAEIIMKQCIKRMHIGTLLIIAKEFHANGVKMNPSTYDICLSAAANTGRIMMLEEIEGWMKEHKIRQSTSSIFSIARGRLIKGKVEEAASVILDGCKDPKKIQRYVGLMVKLWPAELAMSHTGGKKSAKSNMLKTKKSLGDLLDCLAKRDCKLDIDIERDFGTGPGQGDKWWFCFGDIVKKAKDGNQVIDDGLESGQEEEAPKD